MAGQLDHPSYYQDYVDISSNKLMNKEGVLQLIVKMKNYVNSNSYTLPKASTSTLGGVKVDGTTITINNNGVISSSGSSSYTLPTASTSTLGGVKVDGSTITINANGVISSSGGGSSLPSNPSNNGTYILVNTVSGGTATQSWQSVVIGGSY